MAAPPEGGVVTEKEIKADIRRELEAAGYEAEAYETYGDDDRITETWVIREPETHRIVGRSIDGEKYAWDHAVNRIYQERVRATKQKLERWNRAVAGKRS